MEGRHRGIANVLFATDLSPGAARAADRVPLLPFGSDARITLLTVLVPSRGRVDRASIARVRERCASAAVEIERRARKRGAAVGARAEVVVGEPFVEIIRASRALDADLVVVGRRSRPSRWRLGSTAERVVRHGSRPVLIAELAAEVPYQRAVIALDVSDASRDVLELGGLVLEEGARVRLLHAYRVPHEGLLKSSISPAAMRAYEDELRDGARKTLNEVLRRSTVASRGWRVSVRADDPHVAIVREIVRDRADLVVLGTHGRSGVSHFLMGSVAESVLRHAHCDVLVGRPERFTYEPP